MGTWTWVTVMGEMRRIQMMMTGTMKSSTTSDKAVVQRRRTHTATKGRLQRTRKVTRRSSGTVPRKATIKIPWAPRTNLPRDGQLETRAQESQLTARTDQPLSLIKHNTTTPTTGHGEYLVTTPGPRHPLPQLVTPHITGQDLIACLRQCSTPILLSCAIQAA